MNKFERRGAILRLVQQRSLATQSEVAEALRGEGIDAVQTTVSRDIAQLGLVKVRAADGRLIYALPGAADLDRLAALTTALRRWTTSMTAANDLVVIRTQRGYAVPLADAIDDASLADVAGTVAGENTIFVAPRDELTGAELEQILRHHLETD